MSDADCTLGREPRSVAASSVWNLSYFHTLSSGNLSATICSHMAGTAHVACKFNCRTSGGHAQSRTQCKNDSISKTVQNGDVVTVEQYWEVIRGLSNSGTSWWPRVNFKVIHTLQAFSNGIFRTAVQQLTRFQLTSRGPSAVDELLALHTEKPENTF